MSTKDGCQVAPTVNPECTALHLRHLSIILYNLCSAVKTGAVCRWFELNSIFIIILLKVVLAKEVYLITFIVFSLKSS